METSLVVVWVKIVTRHVAAVTRGATLGGTAAWISSSGDALCPHQHQVCLAGYTATAETCFTCFLFVVFCDENVTFHDELGMDFNITWDMTPAGVTVEEYCPPAKEGENDNNIAAAVITSIASSTICLILHVQAL